MADGFVGSGDPAYDAKVLMISVAARMAGMHPQTLRQYDRLGLVQAGRAAGAVAATASGTWCCCVRCSGSARTTG
ncbi:MerR-like DNA binding protein [Micromonospora sagamiensis]|uniref:MerR-like DNA binding protein n=1 Tax=Micromonospora sagamiensis TaxID=47875 RepID=A0A562WP20_9ACTN|nr:MerR-like DNA binding protein [Micromonospora sagamiensis]